MNHILLVDDNTQLTRLMAIALQRDGFAVTTAGSLQEAKDVTIVPDVVIADVRLPNGDGRELRKLYPDTPFLVISGAPMDDPPELAYGHLPFLPKPFTPHQLRQAVRNLLTALSGGAGDLSYP